MNQKACWYLKKLNIFKSLPEKEIEYISDHSANKEYGKKQVLFGPEDRDKVFILKTGRVEIYDLTADGKKIIIDVLGPGNVFGDLGVEELFSKVIESEKQVAALASASLLVKVKNLLFRLVKKHGEIKNEQAIITTKFTHEQLADMIGISRPTMTEFLNKLDRLGIIKRAGKVIAFDPQRLAEV